LHHLHVNILGHKIENIFVFSVDNSWYLSEFITGPFKTSAVQKGLKRIVPTSGQWLMPIILATWEAKIRRIAV
jgi:hypothetical protein